MTYTIRDIENYLAEVKDAIDNNRYRIERNFRRADNINLFTDYVIDEEEAKEILLSLEPTDFSDAVSNEHIGYEHEMLYVFGKEVKLIERFGDAEKAVPLYIKFNKLNDRFVIVISFHEQRYPLQYYFK